MRRLAIATSLLCITSLTGACAGSNEPDDPGPTEPAITRIPSPPAADVDDLVAELDAIAPGLASEPDDTVDNARNVCDSILGGAQNLEQSTATRFTGDGVDEVTPDQAARLVAAIKAAPWCR